MIEHLPNAHKALGSIPNTARQNRKLKFLKFNRCLLSSIKEIALDPRLSQERGKTELNKNQGPGEVDKC